MIVGRSEDRSGSVTKTTPKPGGYGVCAARRSLRVAALCVLSFLGGRADALACPVCFGNGTGPMAEGVNMAILALLGITAGVLGGFVAFFFHLLKRSRLAFGETVRAPGEAEERL